MAGRHRRPPAWRRVLTSLLRSRNRVRTAALRAEILALRATIAGLQEELATLRESAAAAVAAPPPAPLPALPAPVTFDLPLVRLALSGIEVDRGPDTALTEIVLADLPERPLLDPKLDRPAEPADVPPVPATPEIEVEVRRSA